MMKVKIIKLKKRAEVFFVVYNKNEFLKKGIYIFKYNK